MKLNKQQKKDLLIDTIRDLALLMSESSEFVQSQLKPILNGLLKGTMDVKKSLIQINILLKESKSVVNKITWIRVIKIIRKYFDDIK